ncbi:MAG: ribonuclease catalytic domain-containing protein [Thermodesulfobacteriota bacterium]|nr:ribonuclease catalytic domain-containing protein [Thermodesulfobacteriota bacterium]
MRKIAGLDMNQGRIIEYIDGGRFVCALCLQDKGNKLHLLTSSKREVNLSPKRAILISKFVIDTLRPREDLLERLEQIEEHRNRLKNQINVKELWELIRDEKESLSHSYLAQLVFGQTITDDHLSALARALFEDRLHFKMKDGCFLPNSEEKVDQIEKQIEEEALREERLNQGSAWLKDIQLGKKTEDPPCREDIINLLVQLALYGNEASFFKYGKEMLSRAGISNIQETRHLLVRLGIWEEDENTDLIRLGVENSFTKRQLSESARLAGAGIGFEGREDLRDLASITIDGPLTRDYDDAVSLEMVGDITHLGIHIADVAASISQDSILDREARDRASSIYLARRQIPMIPNRLSQDTLSLKQGEDRQAISLLASFEKNGELIEYRVVPSVIRVRQKLTYEEVDETLSTEGLAAQTRPTSNNPNLRESEGPAGMLQRMYQISHHFRSQRINQGALLLSLPESQVQFNADSSLSLKLVDQDTPSRIIVSEIMIFYNWLAAKFCRDNQIPVLFRTQEEPGERFSADEAGYLYYVFQQRRKLKPLQIHTVPGPHSGLGLEVYTQATSPIRRYLDIVVQRQIKNFLMGMDPVYDKTRLEEIGTFVSPVIKNLEKVKRNRLRYWTLKFLSQHLGETYRAFVLDELKSKYRLVLKDILLVAEIKRQSGIILNRGEEILVEVKKVDPWDDLLKLTYAEV